MTSTIGEDDPAFFLKTGCGRRVVLTDVRIRAAVSIMVAACVVVTTVAIG